MRATIRRVVLGMLATLVAVKTARAAIYYWDADGDSSPSIGGTGTWDTVTALWRSAATNGPLVTWPNTVPNSDTGWVQGASGKLTIAGNTTIYVNTLYFGSAVPWAFEGGDANSLLVFSGGSPKVTGTSNAGCTFRNRVDTGSGVTFQQNGPNYPYIFEGTNQLQGAGRVSLANSVNHYGAVMRINGSQDDFEGGFAAVGGTRRNALLIASVTNALGRGVATATGYGVIQLEVWGAQAPASGVRAGIVATNNGCIRIATASTNATSDRFIVYADSALGGGTNALKQISRVTAFSPSPAGPEAILAPGAAILHMQNSPVSMANLGTNADLFFALGANFTSPSFALTVGAGTPWLGLSNTRTNHGETGGSSMILQAGTITIAAGTPEIVLLGFGVDYSSYSPMPLVLGNGTNSPSIVAVGDPVPARIVRYVTTDTTTPQFSGISRFVVSRGARLTSRRSAGLASKPVDLEGGELAFIPGTASSSDTATAVRASADSTVMIRRNTAGTADTLTVSNLMRIGSAVLLVNPSAVTNLAYDERILLLDTNGLKRGEIVDPWIFGVYRNGSFLTYTDTGLSNAVYTTSFGNGNIVRDATTVSGSVNCDSLLWTAVISGSGTINLGILPDGSPAERCGIICTNGASNLTMAPGVNAGTSELVLYTPGTKTHTLNGALTASALTKAGDAIVALANAANSVTGQVTVWKGTLRISGGNGLANSASVYVGDGGAFDVSNPTGNVETNSHLAGIGTVTIASGKGLEILQTVRAGDGTNSLTVTGSGTLTLAGGARLVCDLNVNTTPKTTARVAISSGNITLGTGSKVQVASLAGVPESGPYSDSFVLVSYGGTRMGSFSSVETPAGFNGNLTYDDAGKRIVLEVSRQVTGGTLFLVR